MTKRSTQALAKFENRLFASAADEHKEYVSDQGLSRRYDAAQQARGELISIIQQMEAELERLSEVVCEQDRESIARVLGKDV